MERSAVKERRKMVMELAGQDPVYCAARDTFLQLNDTFCAFAAAQPEPTRQMLTDYTDAISVMGGQMTQIACEHLTLPEDGNPSK